MNSDTDYGRREFVAAAAGCSLALTAPTARTRARAADESPGIVVFSYDDGPVEDYTKAFPVHQEEDVPACVAAVADNVGDDDSLSAERLREMESAGWEIMSHTVKHRALGTIMIRNDVESGASKVYVSPNVHGEHTNDEVLIFRDENHEKLRVLGQGADEQGEFVRFRDSIDERFPAPSQIRYTDDRIRQSIAESKERLEEYGVEVSNLVAPFGIYGRLARRLVPEHYDGVPNTTWRGNGINDPESLDPYEMHRVYFRDGEMTIGELGDFLDGVASRGALGLLGGHSHYERLTADRIRTAIRMVKDRDIEIRTLRDAFDELGISGDANPSYPPPRTFETATPEESTSLDGFGVGAAVAGAGLCGWLLRGE